MNIYVDYDDCLCETARNFTGLVAELFKKNVPYENVRFFNLQKTFELTDEEYEKMMIRSHTAEEILSLKETPGASDTIRDWIACGHNVSVITGRPYSSFEPSRKWLDDHGLADVKLYCFDKYGRDNYIKNGAFNLSPEDYRKMKFDYAIEDSPHAFRFFDHLPELKVLVYDRPWNHEYPLPGDNYFRCFNWDDIRNETIACLKPDLLQ
ncbi:MAG: 2-dehydropantoate 2-reductase [Lachnospiraceae bacterium]|nr:2-dehydropantoate 2-reductase [Lachnospiraceae bacterium]